jgi:hypothetical protein
MSTEIGHREAVAIVTNARTLLAGPVEGGHALVPALAFCDTLGTLLWRAKYGGDRRVLPRAVLLLAQVIRSAHRFKRAPDAAGHARHGRHRNDAVSRRGRQHTPADLADALAARALHEWVDDRCTHCHGRGMVGGEQHLGSRYLAPCRSCGTQGWLHDPALPVPTLAQGERDPRPRLTCGKCNGRGRVDRPLPQTAPSTVCPHCKGSGKARVDHAGRALAIGLALDVYRRHWGPVFDSLFAKLDAIDAKVEHHLRAQLKAGTVAPSLYGLRSAQATDLSPPVGSPGRPAQVEQDPRPTSEREPEQTQHVASARP